jgi:hypothetical protein
MKQLTVDNLKLLKYNVYIQLKSETWDNLYLEINYLVARFVWGQIVDEVFDNVENKTKVLIWSQNH